MSQHPTKNVRPAKIQIGPHILTVWSESLLIACAFYSLQAIQRRINENPCHTGWIYKVIWVFTGHTGLIVGFVMRWLKCYWYYFSTDLALFQIHIQLSVFWQPFLEILFGPRHAKNVSFGICGQRRPRSVCASVQSVQGLCCPLTESFDTTECINGEQILDDSVHV